MSCVNEQGLWAPAPVSGAHSNWPAALWVILKLVTVCLWQYAAAQQGWHAVQIRARPFCYVSNKLIFYFRRIFLSVVFMCFLHCVMRPRNDWLLCSWRLLTCIIASLGFKVSLNFLCFLSGEALTQLWGFTKDRRERMLQLSNFTSTKLAKGSQVRVHWRDWLWEEKDGREKSVACRWLFKLI